MIILDSDDTQNQQQGQADPGDITGQPVGEEPATPVVPPIMPPPQVEEPIEVPSETFVVPDTSTAEPGQTAEVPLAASEPGAAEPLVVPMGEEPTEESSGGADSGSPVI